MSGYIFRRSAAKSSYGVAIFDTPSACGGVIHCPGLQCTTERQKALEAASLVGSVRETGTCGQHLYDPPAGLEKNKLKPWLREQWCIPPKANAAFVCQMEDVLEVYKLPYDAKRPLLCMDEMPKQLLAELS